MKALVVKELHELLREKRFPVFLMVLSVILGLGGMLLLSEAAQGAERGYAFSFREPVMAFLFVGLLSCVLLALTFAADAVAKERDQGMLSLLLTSPVTHAEVLGAKYVALLVIYGAYAALNLLVAALMSLAFGWVVLKTAFWLLVLPLGAFYVFLAGMCVFLSTIFRTSKASIAVGVGAVLPLFIVIKGGPVGYLLRQSKPALYDALGWLPVEASMSAAMSLASGASFPMAPLVVAALAGVAFAFASYATFRAREVAS